jgi:hypothetical protein
MRSDWKSGANTQPSPFAGKELNWLYAAEEGRLFRRPVKVRGLAVDAPVKPQTIVVCIQPLPEKAIGGIEEDRTRKPN